MGSCYNSTVINVPREIVWKTISNFHDMSWGKPVITKLDKVGELDAHSPGAKRVLNDVFHETLVSFDEANFHFTYSIDDGPEPVSKTSVKDYRSTVILSPVTDTNSTFIEWHSVFESSAEEEVSEFCNPIYAGLLKVLKEKLESR